jgi:hypothetical protein
MNATSQSMIQPKYSAGTAKPIANALTVSGKHIFIASSASLDYETLQPACLYAFAPDARGSIF